MSDRFNTLRIIHFGMIMPIIVFSGVVLFLNSGSEEAADVSRIEELRYIPGLLLMLAFWMAPSLFKKQVRNAVKPTSTLEDKLAIYQSAHIVKMALFEAAALFGLVESFVNNHWFNFLIVAIVLLIFVSNMPTVSRFSMIFDLSVEEKNELNT